MAKREPEIRKSKCIGAWTQTIHNQLVSLDMYEDRTVILPNGSIYTLTSDVELREFAQIKAMYDLCVEKDTMFESAYEKNEKIARLNPDFVKPPVSSANPDAAKIEYYQRKNPPVVEEAQPSVRIDAEDKENRGLFGKKKSKKANAKRCDQCGAPLNDGQKFCPECGTSLVEKEVKPVKQVVDEDLFIDDFGLEEDFSASDEPVTVPKEKKTKKAHKGSVKKADEEEKPKKKGNVLLKILLFLIMLLLVGAILCVVYIFCFGGNFDTIVFDSSSMQKEEIEPESPAEIKTEGHVVVKVTTSLKENQLIQESDIEGVILTDEQYEKYSEMGTYIDAQGQSVKQSLLLWKDREDVIGKYAAADISEGSILYDTSITSQHVIADKTYVNAEVNGEEVTYEVEDGVLPGNTKIQIVALVSTDGQEPVQVLLSEMTLEDRSLQSIFNSAGQDILEQLAGVDVPDKEEDDTESPEEEPSEE